MSNRNQAVHVEVTLEECNGNVEKMIRKFSKKLFKSGVLQEIKERQYYVKPSDIRSRSKKSKKYLARQRKKNNLCNKNREV